MPTAVGVNTPFWLMVPPVAVHTIALLKPLVPRTFAEQVADCARLMEEGVAVTETPVTLGDSGAEVVFIVAVPVLVVSCAEVAVHVPAPGPEGVKTPASVMVPPVAVQLTAVLKLPLPNTVAMQFADCPIVREEGLATTETPEIELLLAELPRLRTPWPTLFLSCFEVAVTVATALPEAAAGAE